MSNKIIINAISAVLALGMTGTSTSLLAQQNNTSGQSMMQGPAIQGMERCFNIVKAGANDCGNASHHCGGEAKVDGDKNEWIFVPSGLCNKIVGSSTQSSPQS